MFLLLCVEIRHRCSNQICLLKITLPIWTTTKVVGLLQMIQDNFNEFSRFTFGPHSKMKKLSIKLWNRLRYHVLKGQKKVIYFKLKSCYVLKLKLCKCLIHQDFNVLNWKFWEKVTTTNFTTSKTKKNIEKFANHHYIEMWLLVDYYYNITTTTKKDFWCSDFTYVMKQDVAGW